jgi:hypothetical protein
VQQLPEQLKQRAALALQPEQTQPVSAQKQAQVLPEVAEQQQQPEASLQQDPKEARQR